MNATYEAALTLAVSAGIGLLVGTERERKPTAKAGVRTFTLIAVLGNVCAWLAQEIDSAALLPVALTLVGVTIAGAYLVDRAHVTEEAGTTTVVAALVVFLLGALNFHGERTLAVALGIGTTALLYFKTELEGVATRLTPTDIRSMLQFAAVSAVVLPLLPDRSFGPYGALNPFHIWLMVVLISGVSLAGYVAWRLTLARKGLLLTGLLGGLVSSTATTLVYARHARDATHTPAAALVVILLANGAMLARVLVIVAIIAPQAAWAAAVVLVPALALATPIALWRLGQAAPTAGDGEEVYRNPTNLLAAVAFAAVYALVLLVSAWLSESVGERGVYGLAFVSGLTDVDAITLSSLRLFATGVLDLRVAITAITVAIAANLALKATLVLVVGGRRIGCNTALAFVPALLALAGGLAGVYALA